jgi:hypothetical protein
MNIEKIFEILRNIYIDVIYYRHYVDRIFIIHRLYIRCYTQWRSQPDNFVPLCKFKIIIIIHFFRN